MTTKPDRELNNMSVNQLNKKILNKLKKDIIKNDNQIKRMRLKQKYEFDDRINQIFDKDFKKMNIKNKFIKNYKKEIFSKINKSSKSFKFIRLISSMNKTKKIENIDSSESLDKNPRLSLLSIKRKRSKIYSKSLENKKSKLTQTKKKNELYYLKMVKMAKKNKNNIEKFESKLYQGNKLQKNLNYSNENSFINFTNYDKKSNKLNKTNKKLLFLKKLNPTKNNEKLEVKKKIKQLCEPIKLKNKEKEEKGKKIFDSLILISQIKDIVKTQKSRFNIKNIKYQKQKTKIFTNFKNDLLNNINSSLKTPKTKLKKTYFEKTKFFRENFQKLASFIKEFKIKEKDLYKLIPRKPYDDPDSCNVRIISL